MMIRKQSLLPSERFVFGFIMAVLYFNDTVRLHIQLLAKSCKKKV